MAMAGGMRFKQQKFDPTVAAGDAVVVEFSPPQCPTFRAQKPLVAPPMAQSKFVNVTLFVPKNDNSEEDTLVCLI